MHANAQRAGIFHRANRNLPHQLAGFQVNGRHGAKRRLLARNAQRRQEALAHRAERRAVHRDNPHLDAAGIFRHVRARHHVVCQTQTHIVDEHQAVVRVNGDAAPVHPAE